MKKLIMLLFVSLIATGTFAQQTKKRELLTFEAFEAKLKAAGKNAQILDARLPEEYQQNEYPGDTVADAQHLSG